MSDRNAKEPLARMAGRGLVRMFGALFGGKNVLRARDSVRALKEEFRQGKEEAAPPEPGLKAIPHREKPTAEPGPSSGEPRRPSTGG